MIQDAKVTMSEATEMTVHPTCPFCGDTTSVVVDAAGFVAWQSGELVQNALADLEGIMPDYDQSGDREHPAWTTIEELKSALDK